MSICLRTRSANTARKRPKPEKHTLLVVRDSDSTYRPPLPAPPARGFPPHPTAGRFVSNSIRLSGGLSATARARAANRRVDRAQRKTPSRADRPGHTERSEPTAVAVRRMVLHEPQRQVRPVRETPRGPSAHLPGILVSNQYLDIRHVPR